MGVIYIDTEYSIELADLPKYGVDNSPEKFKLINGNKVEEINILLTQLLDSLKEEKMKRGEIEPFLIVLDSVGQMSSNKEKEDLISGNIKVDMTRAKALAAMFRSINIDLGYLGIPMVVCNHVYLEQGSMYPQEILKGGKALVYSSSVIGMMSKAKLKTQEEDEMDLGASGIVVTFKTAKNRLAKPKKIKFEISFIHGMNPYTGLDAFCRPEFYQEIGIAQGKEEVDKSTGEITFKPGGHRWFVRHLDKSVTTKQLFSPNVFTDEVLQRMAPIVNGYFKYKSFDEMQEFEEQFAQLEESMDEFRDISDADELFG
jgi:RecA/RadA recombinase